MFTIPDMPPQAAQTINGERRFYILRCEAWKTLGEVLSSLVFSFTLVTVHSLSENNVVSVGMPVRKGN